VVAKIAKQLTQLAVVVMVVNADALAFIAGAVHNQSESE